MARPRSAVPAYRRHRKSGQAIVTLRTSDGARRDVLLGKHGTADSKKEYARILAEWQATGGLPVLEGKGTTVNSAIVHYWRHAQKYYVSPDGRQTNEVVELRYALQPLKALYGHTDVATFGPLALKAVRDQMIAAGWCRTRVNKQVGRIKRAFKWLASEELVPAAVYHGLSTVGGLARGRSVARETDPVRPVPEAHVNATLAHLSAPVAAMVELQRLTGMRPGEVCIMRACDLDVSGPVWLYRPARHKNDWRGRDRVICIGPKAQAVLRPFLKLDVQAYLFSPTEAEADRTRDLRLRRATPLYPSHLARYERQHGKRPRRRLGNRYRTESYTRAIVRACEKADVPAWSANRLRHNHATEVRRRFGLEAAGAALGHAQMSATEIYAERDEQLARRVAAEIG